TALSRGCNPRYPVHNKVQAAKAATDSGNCCSKASFMVESVALLGTLDTLLPSKTVGLHPRLPCAVAAAPNKRGIKPRSAQLENPRASEVREWLNAAEWKDP